MAAKKASAPKKKDCFEFTTKNGATIVLPSLSNMKPGLIRKVRKLSTADQMFTILEATLSEVELAHVDDMEQAEFADLLQDWAEWSGVSLGE